MLMVDNNVHYSRAGFDGSYNSGDWGDDNHGWDDGPSAGWSNSSSSSKTDEGLVKTIGAVIAILLAVLALPLLIVAVTTYWAFFRIGRYRPRFIVILNLIVTIIGLIWFSRSGGFEPLMGVIHGFDASSKDAILSSLSGLPVATMTSLLPLSLVLGPWVGFGFTIMQCMKMRSNPHLIVNEGLSPKWMYHFRFRMSPVEVIMAHRRVDAIKKDTLRPYHRRDLIPMGVEVEPLNPPENPMKVKSDVLICRAEDEVPKHTMVTGAAGSGKTVTLKSMMTRDIDNGKTIIVIDCKKDPEVAEFLSRRARGAGRNFYHFSADLPYRIQGNPEGPSSYDPLSSGSVAKNVDMMLNMREWDVHAAVYRDQAQSFLSKVFAVMNEAEKYGVLDKVPALDTKQGKMWTLTQMLNPSVFNAVVVSMNQIPEAAYVRQQASELNALLSSSRRSSDVQAAQRSKDEYLSKMSGLMVSSYGKWLKGGEGAGSGEVINISELSADSGNVILFSLDAAQKNDLGSIMGSLICSDLANMTETRKNLGQDNPVGVYIDEFQSLPPDCVKSMLQKARSAGVGLTLAFQSLDQVSSETGSDTYVKSLLDTCSNFIFHAGSNYDTGLLASKIIGTHIINKYAVNRRNETKFAAFNWNNNRDLQVSTAQTDDWIVNPSEFAKLSMPNKQNGYKSEAIIIKKASSDPIDNGTVGAVAHKTHMIPPDCVLAEYFDPKSEPIDINEPLAIRMSRGMIKDVHAAMQAAPVDGLADMMSAPVSPVRVDPFSGDDVIMNSDSDASDSTKRKARNARRTASPAPSMASSRKPKQHAGSLASRRDRGGVRGNTRSNVPRSNHDDYGMPMPSGITGNQSADDYGFGGFGDMESSESNGSYGNDWSVMLSPNNGDDGGAIISGPPRRAAQSARSASRKGLGAVRQQAVTPEQSNTDSYGFGLDDWDQDGNNDDSNGDNINASRAPVRDPEQAMRPEPPVRTRSPRRSSQSPHMGQGFSF